MVFHCRCLSFLLDEHEDAENETRFQTDQSTATEKFYTADSTFNQPAHSIHGWPPRIFTISELKAATKNFHKASKIAEGGYGSVYKGVIRNSEHPFNKIHVVVKPAKGVLQGHEKWQTTNVLVRVRHPNLVKVVGYCAQDNELGTTLLLVYEYMVNRSVRDHLSAQSETPLSWNKRLKVAHDVARGLTHLHEQAGNQIILRDFKSSNILLDDQWNAKILLNNFGVAHSGPQEVCTHISTTEFAGTLEYAAPEYLSVESLTSKSNVWSYGMFVYELITGRRPLDKNRPPNEQKLLEWMKPYLESKRFKKITDPRLGDNYSLKAAQKLCIIANKCLFENPESRPKMSEVLKMINRLPRVASQASSPSSPQVLQVAVDTKKVFWVLPKIKRLMRIQNTKMQDVL